MKVLATIAACIGAVGIAIIVVLLFKFCLTKIIDKIYVWRCKKPRPWFDTLENIVAISYRVFFVILIIAAIIYCVVMIVSQVYTLMWG